MLPDPTGVHGEDAGWALLEYICSTYECISCGLRAGRDDVILIEYFEVNGRKTAGFICKSCDEIGRQVTVVDP